MATMQILQWLLWGLSLLTAAVAVVAVFRLRDAERVLPAWNKLREIEALLPVRQDELRQVSEAVERCRAEIGQLEATVSHLRILKEWRDANPEAPARIQQMMTDLERCKSELAAIQQKLAQDEQRLNDITQETMRLTLEKAQLTQEISTFRDQLAGLHKQKAEYEKTVRELDDQRRHLEPKVAGLKHDVQSTEGRLAALQQQVKQAEQRLNDITQETMRLTLEKAQLTQEISTFRDQLAGLHKQKAEYEKTVRELDDQRRHLEPKVAGLKHDVQSTERRLAALQQQVEQAEQEKATAVRDRDQARADCNAAKAELTGLQTSLDTYKALVENLNTQLKQASVGHTDLAKALEDLAQPALKFEFRRSSNLEESAALRHLAAHLKEKGLYFPERVQLAFHTSLKAAHINPLVVLAGVSGTGKSALPMAYAEAMGMNFVSLAVQPGWSGPQDLLGFYNYLERKYKATELARALAQMSRFSTDDLPGLKIQSRKEQMLLLLLDEMNLARVEYDFSRTS